MSSYNVFSLNPLKFYYAILTFQDPTRGFIVEKGENAGHQQFLLFHNVFYLSEMNGIICVKLKMSRFNGFKLEKSELCTCVNAYSNKS